ncbi:hypothetical protein Syun_005422 [Stephania yunnanensis]|uniref:Uncharacterized protein n=1 Tax=Stephania yunnanensis TaxID=152371 RepID=A0AAP0L7D9_9MAGN
MERQLYRVIDHCGRRYLLIKCHQITPSCHICKVSPMCALGITPLLMHQCCV